MFVEASKIRNIVQRAMKSKDMKIFLGGSCDEGNKWRKDIKKEYGKDFFLIDPYDENYDPSDNTYDEVAGMLCSDYVIFYRPGKQSQKEKEFLHLMNTDRMTIREFNDIDDLRQFLKSVRSVMVKKASLAGVLRDIASNLDRTGMPHVHSLDPKKEIDALVEQLDWQSLTELKSDLESGKTIKIPDLGAPGIVPGEYNLKNLTDNERTTLNQAILRGLRDKRTGTTLMYDPLTKSYMKRVAKSDATYSLSCTSVELPEQLAREVISWGERNVPDSDLNKSEDSMGREDEIHVTLLYGLTTNEPSDLEEILNNVKQFEVRLGLINAFKDAPGHDVLKISVECPELERLHYALRESLDHKNKFPTYQPHVTIAYVKKGKADRLIGSDRFRGRSFKATEIVFSDKDHNKTKIPLGG